MPQYKHLGVDRLELLLKRISQHLESSENLSVIHLLLNLDTALLVIFLTLSDFLIILGNSSLSILIKTSSLVNVKVGAIALLDVGRQSSDDDGENHGKVLEEEPDFGFSDSVEFEEFALVAILVKVEEVGIDGGFGVEVEEGDRGAFEVNVGADRVDEVGDGFEFASVSGKGDKVGASGVELSLAWDMNVFFGGTDLLVGKGEGVVFVLLAVLVGISLDVVAVNLAGLFLVLLENVADLFWKRGENTLVARAVKWWSASKHVSHNEHELDTKSLVGLWVLDVCTNLLEMSRAEESVEGKCTRLNIVQMRYQSCKVVWSTIGLKQLMLSKVLNGESQMMDNLLLERLSSENQTGLGQQTLNRLLCMFRVTAVMQENEQTKDERNADWEMTNERWKTRAYQTSDSGRWQTVEDDITDKIETSTTSTTSCLTVVQGRQVERITSKDDGLTRHVDTESKSSSGDNDPEESLSKQHFHTRIKLAFLPCNFLNLVNLRLAILSVHTSMMDTDTTSQTLQEALVDTVIGQPLDFRVQLSHRVLGRHWISKAELGRRILWIE